MNLDRQCPFCSGSRLRGFMAAAYDVSGQGTAEVCLNECVDCVAAWQWPRRRSVEASEQVFRQAYSEQRQNSYFDPGLRDQIARMHGDFVQSRYGAGPTRRLLDFGCGDGAFVRHMHARGWQAFGFDPALPVASGEAPASEEPLLARELPDLRQAGPFDVVTLFDVIEHVDDPCQLLSTCASLVKPGGLLVLETGNYQSIGRIQSGPRWWNYQADHRWYFAPPQLETLLSRAGFGEFAHAHAVLRPWWRPPARPPVGRLALARAMLRRPAAISELLSRRELIKRATADWARWCDLEITALSAVRLGQGQPERLTG